MTPQAKKSYRLNTACAAAGVVMVIGGLAGVSGASELTEVPVQNAAYYIQTSPPVTPGPTEPHKAQPARKPPIHSQPAGGAGAGFYKHCREALSPGPRSPGSNSPFDHDGDGKACEY